MYLFILPDSQITAAECSQEDLEMADSGELMIIRFANRRFESAIVEALDEPENENSEEGNTMIVYEIVDWEAV